MKKLNLYEKELLIKINLNSGYLISEFQNLVVERVGEEDLDFYHLRLHYPGHPWRGGGYSIIADWLGNDSDGVTISLLALGDEERRVYEIEIRRFDMQPIQKLPAVETWRPA